MVTLILQKRTPEHTALAQGHGAGGQALPPQPMRSAPLLSDPSSSHVSGMRHSLQQACAALVMRYDGVRLSIPSPTPDHPDLNVWSFTVRRGLGINVSCLGLVLVQ